jgi:hypothetical protein
MITIQESVEGDDFIEFVLTEHEAKEVLNYQLVEGTTRIRGRKYLVGIRIEYEQGRSTKETKDALEKIW